MIIIMMISSLTVGYSNERLIHAEFVWLFDIDDGMVIDMINNWFALEQFLIKKWAWNWLK